MSDREIPDGYILQWVADDGWKFGGDGHTCRMKGCRRPAIAALQRKRNTKHGSCMNWWYYCDSHLYGRKIEDGVVKFQRLVEAN